MTSRREFLNFAMKGSVLTAAAALMPGGALAARNSNEEAATTAAQNAANTSRQGHYKPPFKFGMGRRAVGE
jgi:D-threo-aldose 1-dehydrogenase